MIDMFFEGNGYLFSELLNNLLMPVHWDNKILFPVENFGYNH